jgi:hypothetical protein
MTGVRYVYSDITTRAKAKVKFRERRMLARFGIAFLIAGVMSAVVQAQPKGQEPPSGCKAWDTGLPAAWAPWAETVMPVTAASAPVNASKAAVFVGRKVSVTLEPAKSVRMAVETPETDAPANAHKGILSLAVQAYGYYWIASSEGLWIDVVANGAIIMSTDHGPGPHCASIRKAVQFMLKAGDAFIQLSDNRGPKVDLLALRQP